MKKLLVPALMVLLAVGSIVFTACEGVTTTEENDALLYEDCYGYVECSDGHAAEDTTVNLLYSLNGGSTWYSAGSDVTNNSGFYEIDPDIPGSWGYMWMNARYKITACHWENQVGYTGNSGVHGWPKYRPINEDFELNGCWH